MVSHRPRPARLRHPFFDAALPHLFAHRGASGEAPENTLLAFKLALRQGVRYLETDCRSTRDGEIVLLHDASLERTTDGQGQVAGLRWSELASLDAGHRFSPDGSRFPFRGQGARIPRLCDALDAFPAARFNVEIKSSDPGIIAEVLRLVRAARASERVLLTCAEDSGAAALHALSPDTALGSSLADVLALADAIREDALDHFRARGHALQVPAEFMGRPVISAEMVDAAHQVGLFVHVWTINDPVEMHRLLGLGVDGLMSDFPGRLLAAAGEAR
jgi:glycerophosphoryl diester phosphodiesterase